MQPVIILSVVLLASVVASHSTKTLRRDGVLHLYPFPRIGRASERTWQIPDNDYLDHEQVKRQLYAFPRVGRNDLSQSDAQLSPQLENILFDRRSTSGKRDSKSRLPIMWFGPRMRRAYKKENDDHEQVNDLSQSDAQLSPQLENMIFDTRNTFDKRESKLTSKLPIMWFGPREGRAYKKETDDLPLSDNEEMQEETEYNREKRNTKLT